MPTMNPSSPLAITPARTQPFWKRRLFWASLGLLFLFSVLGTVYGVAWVAAQRALQEALAEADRLDPGWRLQDLEAQRAPVPDEENAALQAVAVKRLLPAKWPTAKANQLTQKVRAPEQLTEAQLALLQAEFANAAWARAEVRKLALLPRGRYPLSTDSRQSFGLDALALARVLLMDALLLAQEGDVDGALRSCRGSLNAGRSFGDEPVFLSQLVRLACQTVAVRGIEYTLAQGEPTDAALADLQEFLGQEEAEPLLLHMMRGERAGIQEAVQAGKAELSDLTLYYPSGPLEHVELSLPGAKLQNIAGQITYLNQMVEIAKAPVEEQAGLLQELDAALGRQPLLVRRSVPVLRGLAVENSLSGHANLRCAVAALAAERYRQQYGHWPEQLSALVPGFLGAVSLDPFDGAPLRLRRTDDGLVIYSPGADRQDNGGKINRENSATPGTDVGLRLWDAGKRRQPAPEPAEK
jgi:hypothetical protein